MSSNWNDGLGSSSRRWLSWVLAGAFLCAATGGPTAQQATDSPTAGRSVPSALASAPRPQIPSAAADLWFVPESARKPQKLLTDFAAGVRLIQDGKPGEGLPLVSAPGLADTPLAQYATYYAALARLNLSKAAEARAVFASLHAAKLEGYLAEGSVMREAEAALAQEDFAGAAKLFGELAARRTASPDAVLLALGRAQRQAGDRQKAAESFARLYYEFPLSDLSAVATTELDGLKDLQPVQDSTQRYKLELGRAERLFGSKKYTAARDAFDLLRPVASGDEAELVALRLAECDYYLKKFREAKDRLAPFLSRASRRAEARFFSLTATRELGDHEAYVREARALVDDFPQDSWAEETLNNLATHYILVDEDEAADAVFRELYQKFPKGRHAERAAWKAGWWSYKHGRYQEASTLFEAAATGFPRSDYRPSYLYWSARAREAASDKNGAALLYRTVAADYLNSYYGRLASKRMTAAGIRLVSNERADASSAVPDAAPSAARFAQAPLVTMLLSLEMYDQARDELLYAQRTGIDSPAITATLAWIANKTGDLRRGIILMKRAYPQYMSAEGASLPDDLLRVIFPIDYWTLIKRYAPTQNLDPYLVAALINQESSFQADAKSGANAIGLMQVLPSTGKRYARVLKIRPFSTGSLTKPEVNIRLGTAYFSELVRRLGGLHYALASYNAGEHRVAVWTSERPGVERDEFIDDIPFPETQTYVKKIIGTADDYRRLYGEESAPATAHAAKTAAGSTPAKGKPAAKAAPTKKPATTSHKAPTTSKKTKK